MNLYEPTYETSRALVIGINNYHHVSPLTYAVHDAEGMRDTLVDHLGFPADKITILLNDDATKENILRSLLEFAEDGSAPNDRILFFFAGHGHTRRGNRHDIGFLVPVDGNASDLSSLIRWDELTRDSELIQAKHMLFVMDACYGGLALTRALPAGSLRFVKDMVQRFSRQVITAGKADEVVSDSGGPLPDHSVFTGHLIEALRGKAVTSDGILTATGVMSYVYERVAKDPQSNQTPHYGFFDGDGDLVFRGLPEASSETDEDVLVTVPASEQAELEKDNDLGALASRTKELLAEKRYVIPLHDLMIKELRRFLSLSTDDFFAVQGKWSPDEFRERIKKYEAMTERLQAAAACISHWGESEHQPILDKIVTRMTDRLEPESGLVIWSALRWYPLLLLAYTSGIAAVAAGKYTNLTTVLEARVRSHRSPSEIKPLISALTDVLTESHDAFKTMPGHEKNYTPRSEYLFKLLQPMLDDLLFLGRDYEMYFDRFEVIFALVCADKLKSEMGTTWGPFGRFGYKYRSRLHASHPYGQVIAEAASQRDNWPPITAGLFNGSYDHFEEIASEYEERIKQLNWF